MARSFLLYELKYILRIFRTVTDIKKLLALEYIKNDSKYRAIHQRMKPSNESHILSKSRFYNVSDCPLKYNLSLLVVQLSHPVV